MNLDVLLLREYLQPDVYSFENWSSVERTSKFDRVLSFVVHSIIQIVAVVLLRNPKCISERSNVHRRQILNLNERIRYRFLNSRSIGNDSLSPIIVGGGRRR